MMKKTLEKRVNDNFPLAQGYKSWYKEIIINQMPPDLW